VTGDNEKSIKLGYQEFGELSNDEIRWIDCLDREIHKLWGLGRNLVLVWTPLENGIQVLVIPHYTISEHAQKAREEMEDFGPSALGLKPTSFIEDVISNPKHVTIDGIHHLAQLLDHEPVDVELPFSPGLDLNYDLVEAVIKRYSISYIQDRAVALFDIVGFSLLPPLQQVTQLNSLAYSVNSAYSKMLEKDIDISFTRSTTGDGFYIWNRDRSIQANVNLYHFMHLVLADNAIANSKSSANTTPELRACFHIGGHYEFYQSEGLNPTIYSYIVGDVTIELARMIDCAKAGQVLVGNFRVPILDRETGLTRKIDTVEFIEFTQRTLSSLEGIVLSGDRVEDIQCYLTGEKQGDNFAIKKYLIADKHGFTRDVFNAKINIYRDQADPIYLGAQTSDLDDFECVSESFV
jgi:hypothetical protein